MPEDPFGDTTREGISAIIKSLEKRWGLTLVSFIPPDAQVQLVQLQHQIGRLWGKDPDTSLRESRFSIEYYHPEQFHCTQYTLRRSDPGGPVQLHKFVKQGHQLIELFEMLVGICTQMRPMTVSLNRLRIATDSLGIVLLGEFQGESVEYRRRLLTALNDRLEVAFYPAPRSSDADSSKYHQAHCCIGYLKRPPSFGYEELTQRLEHIEFAPITCTFDKVVLVHHRFRSLQLPEEGSFAFPLGNGQYVTQEEFVQALNLAQ